MFKNIFNSCQYLESIMIWCDGSYLNKKKVLVEVVAMYLPTTFMS